MTTITFADRLPNKSKYTKLDIYNILKQYYLSIHIKPDENDIEEAEHMIANTRFALIENYTPDCPGWTGDVLFILPPGGVEVAEVITLKNKAVDEEIYELVEKGRNRL